MRVFAGSIIFVRRAKFTLEAEREGARPSKSTTWTMNSVELEDPADTEAFAAF